MNNLTMDEIYRSEYKNIYNYIRMKINNRVEAEDLTSEVFLKVTEHLSSYNPEKKLSTWLFTIAKNILIDYFRKGYNNNYTNVSNFINDDGDATFQFTASKKANADYDIETKETQHLIRQKIRTLEPQLKRIAILYFIKNMKYTQISEICEIPLGSVKGFIYRVREILQVELKGMYNSKKVNT